MLTPEESEQLAKLAILREEVMAALASSPFGKYLSIDLKLEGGTVLIFRVNGGSPALVSHRQRIAEEFARRLLLRTLDLAQLGISLHTDIARIARTGPPDRPGPPSQC